MQYVKLTVPQHIYEELGLHPNKTLVLKRSENICGLDAHGNNVSSSEKFPEVSSHWDEPVLTTPEIGDACEENESSLQMQDGTSQAINRRPGYKGKKDVRIQYPRACVNCNQKYFTSSSYFGHFERCRFMPRIQIASYPDRSPDLHMIPEAFHALGYDAPVLAEPEINDTPDQKESSQINAESYSDSSDDFNMIPEALHALCYDTLELSEPEINTTEETDTTEEADTTEENESSLQKHDDDTSRVFLNPSNIDTDSRDGLYLSIKAVFPRPCPLCDKMCNAKSTYYEHRKSCLSMHGKSNFPKRNISNFDYSYMTPAELRVLGYGEPVLAEHEINNATVDGEENESSLQMHDGTSEANILNPSDEDAEIENARIKYPRTCPLCNKMCNSSSIFYKHRRRCRPIEIPKNSSVIRYYDYGSSSDSSDHLDVTPEELGALGGDPPVLAESEVNKNKGTANPSSSGSRNAFQGMRTFVRSLHIWRKKLYPRVCAKCGRRYLSKESFCNHKKRCSLYAAKRNGSSLNGSSRNGIHTIIVEGRRASFVYDPPQPEINKMNEGEASNAGDNKVKTSRRLFCLDCRRGYGTKFAFKRHLKSCGHSKIGTMKRVRIGDYVLPLSARRYHEPRQDKLMGASDKEDKPVNWVPVTTKTTSALKYFVANKNSS